MSKLFSIPRTNSDPELHIIFVHGFMGNKDDSWKNDETGLYWPESLKKEDELNKRANVWVYNYEISLLSGQNQILTVVDSLYKEIISGNRFSSGNIVFVAHSLGGIIVKQLIRNIKDNVVYKENNTKLLQRVKGIIFLATPHTGSIYAKYAAMILDKFSDQNISKDMLPNNTYITELCRWYYKYSEKSKIIDIDLVETISLYDGYFRKIFFKICYIIIPGVIFINMLSILPLTIIINILKRKGDFLKISGNNIRNNGLNVRSILVDEDHVSICKPKNKSNQVYKIVKSIIYKIINS